MRLGGSPATYLLAPNTGRPSAAQARHLARVAAWVRFAAKLEGLDVGKPEDAEAVEARVRRDPLEATEARVRRGPLEAAEARVWRDPLEAAEARVWRDPLEAAEARVWRGPLEAAEARVRRGPLEAAEARVRRRIGQPPRRTKGRGGGASPPHKRYRCGRGARETRGLERKRTD